MQTPRYITLSERLANNPVLNEKETENELPVGVNRHYPKIEINDTVQAVLKTDKDSNKYSQGIVTAIDADGITIYNNRFPTKDYKIKKIETEIESE